MGNGGDFNVAISPMEGRVRITITEIDKNLTVSLVTLVSSIWPLYLVKHERGLEFRNT